MGFPVGYTTELVLPKLLVQLVSVLGFIRKLVTILFCYLGLSPDTALQRPERVREFQLVSAGLLIEEILPVTKFSELQADTDSSPPPESCAVCLYDFEGDDEIRRLPNCCHIFHRGCLDRWIMGYDHRTCPLCRTPLISQSHHIQQDCDTLWEASGIPDFNDY